MSDSGAIRSVRIAGREIGPGRPCFVIAEAGVNHNGSLRLALEMVDAAADAGADAVKFQTFSAARLVTATAKQAAYQTTNTGREESQFEMLRRLELAMEDFAALQARAQQRGIIFLSTPFDEIAATELNALGVPAFKISSGDLTNIPFLQHVAAFGKPVILSTGMADLNESYQAVQALREAGNAEIIVLHCTSNYPSPPEELNLRAMQTLQTQLAVPTGYSDHTEDALAAWAAVAMGACMLEKHFTLDRKLPGPDHKASLEPGALMTLIRGIRSIEHMLGTGEKKPFPSERAVALVARKSVVAAVDIAAGAIIGPEMLRIKRPGDGIPPAEIGKLPGKRCLRAIAQDEVLHWEDLA